MAEKKVVPLKKHTPHLACDEGKHVYIVTSWQKQQNTEKASAMRCQHCLKPMDMQEIESAEWNKKNDVNQD
jgi:hypothetical protein